MNSPRYITYAERINEIYNPDGTLKNDEIINEAKQQRTLHITITSKNNGVIVFDNHKEGIENVLQNLQEEQNEYIEKGQLDGTAYIHVKHDKIADLQVTIRISNHSPKVKSGANLFLDVLSKNDVKRANMIRSREGKSEHDLDEIKEEHERKANKQGKYEDVYSNRNTNQIIAKTKNFLYGNKFKIQ